MKQLLLMIILGLLSGCDGPANESTQRPDHRRAKRDRVSGSRVTPNRSPEEQPEPRQTDPVLSKLSANASNYTNSLHDVRTSFNAGQYDKALGKLDDYLRENPSDADAYYLRGRCLEATSQPEKAIQAYGLALQQNAAHLGASAHRGMIYYNSRRFREALVDLKTYHRQISDTGEKLRVARIIQTLEKQLRSPTAPQDSERKIFDALGKNPERLTNPLRQALGLAKQGNYSQAMQLLSRMLRDKPEHLEALVLRTFCQLKLQQYPEARATATRTSQLAPTDSRPYYQRGMANLNLKHRADALEDFRRYLKYEKDPKNRRKIQKIIRQLESASK